MSAQLNPEEQTVKASRNLRESGSSIVLTIPPAVLDSLDLEVGDSLTVVGDWGEKEMRIESESDTK